ncbi:MAG: glycosyl hydrolase, family 16 [Phycisphaerales bacterium]|nr:glycosyl hydrolase, family 16 [Phycisphaerales bacterium]
MFKRAGNRPVGFSAAVLSAVSVVVCAAPSIAQASPPGTGWDIVFADEFSGSALDTMKWNYNYSWGRTHNHRAYMRESQVIVGGGMLNLQAIAQRDPSAPSYVDTSDFGRQSLDYTSGAVNTSGKFNFTGGYVEARMKMDDTAGTWPAFWMLQGGWPPEVDVMEFPRGTSNSASQYWANYHYTNTAGANASYGWHDTRSDMTTGFHTFGFAWSSSAMTFYFDGAATHTVNDASAIADAANMYMILNHAIGGWAGTPAADSAFPVDFQTDWVRVWQQRPAGSSTTSTWNVNGGGAWDTSASWTGLVPKYGGQQVKFGSVGAVAAASVTWSNSRTVGGITFDGGTTSKAYTIGSSAGSLQMAGSGAAANAYIEALSTSQADQTINARLDLYNFTDLRNNMVGHSLVLNGVITGDGGLSVDGVGTIQFSNNNTYTGDTTIDPGAQGPAVARITRSRALGTGAVNLGPGGNATTARIEIMDGRELPNPINFSGRNNTSVGIQSLASVGGLGKNLLSGTISAQVGGATYAIQSDAGLLELSGGATGASGIALRAGATGTRTFTLQGAGDGVVTGIIDNGAGAVAITKAGAGTWSLTGANTYTGATTVGAGTLAVTGSIATSSGVTVNNAGGTFDAAARQTVKALTVTAGQARVSSAAVRSALSVGDGTLAASQLSLTGGKLDLMSNGLAVNYAASAANDTAALASVRSQLKAGFGANGDWKGATGITSSAIDALSAVGYALASDVLPFANGATTDSFLGSTVDKSTVVARHTLNGDANLDGIVDFIDLARLAQSYNVTDGTRTWPSGDFNYDGTTDFLDLARLAQNYNTSLPSAPVPGAPADFSTDLARAFASVPEPASALLLLSAALLLTVRRPAPTANRQ